MADTALKIWSNVPDRSILEVWLESETDTWAGGARLVTSRPTGSQQEEQVVHAQLSPGPKRQTLVAGRGYTVRLRVAFAGSAATTVMMRARIVKPGGSTYGSPWGYRVRGTNAEVQRATVIAVAKPPADGS